VRDTDGVVKQWEAIKREEKNDAGGHYLADLPTALPALMRAQKAQKKAARVNFDWTEISDVVAKVDEELAEAQQAIASGDQNAIRDEIGDLLFAVVNLARKSNSMQNRLQTRPINSSRGSTSRRRIARTWEGDGRGRLEELDQMWNAVKLKWWRRRNGE
jgi:tetrapyrrole methylase family protein/MazG family protein